MIVLSQAATNAEAAPATQPVAGQGVSITYRLDQPMRVSLNVYDANGQIVRALMNGAPRRAGEQTEFWDGRDRNGKPLPAGQYTWKTLAMPGRLKTEFLLTVGTNFPDPTPDPKEVMEQYRAVAPGTHGGPSAVAEDASGVYIGAGCTENIENYLVKLSRDGSKRLWWKGTRVAWKGAQAMARSGERLLVLSNNDGEIWPYLAADGKDLPVFSTAMPAAANELPDKRDPTRFPSDLAANDREAVVCFPGRGVVRWLDPATGVVNAEVANLVQPASVAIKADGTTFVICGKVLMRLDRAGKNHAVLASDLADAGPLAVLKDGSLLVFMGGSKSQIVHYSPEGKALGAYGAAGGRRDGRYDIKSQENFLRVTDISAAPDGGFLVSEPWTGPRRTAKFDAQGHFQREWYGGNVWAPWIAVDPENPSTVFMPTAWGWGMRLEVDYTTKTWKVRSIHYLQELADGLVPNHNNADLYKAFRHDGKLYLAHERWPWVVLRVDDANEQLVPLMVAMPEMRHYFKEQRGPVREWAAGDDESFLWTDANGDGRPQRDEVQFFKQGGPWTGVPAWDEGGITAADGVRLKRWSIKGWNKIGAPELGDFPAGAAAAVIPGRDLPLTAIEGRWGSYIASDPRSGGQYVAINANMPDWGKSKESYLVSYDAQNNIRWIAGGKTIGTPQVFVSPGDIGCFRRIVGLTHDCIVLNDFMEGASPLTSYVWDKDGLWVGGVMDEIDRKAAPTWRYGAGGESLGTTLTTNSKTGEVLLFWHGLNDIRIGRVTGWDAWKRQSGVVQLNAPADPSTPTLTEVAPGTGTGLWLEGWKAGEPKPAVRRLTNAAESWGPGAGVDGLAAFNGLNARVTGEVQPLHSGWHTFAMDNGQMDNYHPHTRYHIAGIDLSQYAANEVYLEAGKRYPIQIDYNPAETPPGTNQGIQLRWATPRGTWPGLLEPIPVTQLYPTAQQKKP